MLTEDGHQISAVANLEDRELERLAGGVADGEAVRPAVASDSDDPEKMIAECMRLVAAMDSRGLEDTLYNCSAQLSRPRMLEEVICPLIDELGKRWQKGELRIAHEHLASSVLRTLLGRMVDSSLVTMDSPVIVTTTLQGQRHELGSLIVGVLASFDGWRVVPPGADLPAEEIAAVVRGLGAKVLALSIVYPPDNKHLGEEVRMIRRLIGDEVLIIAGGGSAQYYAEEMNNAGVETITDHKMFRQRLAEMRQNDKQKGDAY
jgi:methanogenic corrinoid protein MtbC1